MYRAIQSVLLLVLALLLGAVPSHAAVFGLVDTGELYKSADNGVTWSIHATLPVSDAVSLAAGTSTLDLYLVTRSGTLYHSTDGGANWSAVGALTASDVTAMTILPSGKILALTETGTLYASTDMGATFTGLAALTSSDWASLAHGPSGRLYALTRTGQVAQSADGGATWTSVSVITTSNAVSIRRRSDQLFVLTETGEFYRSIDYGVSWTPVAALTSSSMSAMIEVGTTLLAATRQGEVASSGTGVSWTWIGAINQLNVMALGADTPLATGVPVEGSPPSFVVTAPRPNPTSAASTFSITMGKAEPAWLEAYDVAGRLRARRSLGSLGAGLAAIPWDPGLAPATYLVRVVTPSGRSDAAKWTIVR